jgi:hypothetical protein
MLNLQEASPTIFIAWTGGKPNLGWTALDPSDRGLSTPAQYRTTSVSAAMKSHATRQTGLPTKMMRKGDLKEFETAVWTHLLDHGLDTISFLPDAVDKTRLSSVFMEYTRFSVDSATIQARLIVKKFDKYDRMNDKLRLL